jgi:hypothetical protein
MAEESQDVFFEENGERHNIEDYHYVTSVGSERTQVIAKFCAVFNVVW